MFSEKQLKEMAQTETTALVEGGELENAKPIYWHTIFFQRGGSAEEPAVSRILGYMIILSNSDTAITLSDFQSLLATQGFVGVVINGKGASSSGSDLENMTTLTKLEYYSPTICKAYIRNDSTNIETAETISFNSGWVIFQDLGANKIN